MYTPQAPRAPSRFRSLILVALLALLSTTVLTMLPSTATATVPTTTTTTTATVKGLVRGVNQITGYDGPLAGATVKISQASTGKTLRYVTTNSDGRYYAAGLPAVGVKVKIRKPGWLGTYVGGARTWDSAKVYRLYAGTTTWLPKTLVYAEAVVQGQTLSWMDPVDGVKVTVFNADTGKALASTVSVNGEYRIGQLPPGNIKVRGTRTGLITSWADGGTTWASARTYTLKAGQTLSQLWDPMVLYLDLAPAPVFTGETFGLNNDPVNGWDDPVPGARIDVMDAVTGKVVATTTTTYDPFGRFSVIVPRQQGDYKIRVSKAGWLTTYAPNAFTWDDAMVYSLSSADYVKDIGLIYMFAPAAVQGQTLGWFDPLGGVTVKAYDAATGRLLGTTVSDINGDYRLGNLPPVGVKVRASKTGWNTGWADGAPSWSTATVFPLSPGVTLSQSWDPMVLYLDLSPAGS